MNDLRRCLYHDTVNAPPAVGEKTSDEFGIDISFLFFCLLAVSIGIGLSACQSFSQLPSTTSADEIEGISAAPEAKHSEHVFSAEPLRPGFEHFKRGDYGLAEKYFRDAVEKDPTHVAAWIGLGASYDHIKRFDLADRAYRSAIRLSGETVQILNNQGYSYMLRGDFNNARVKFQKAFRLDPSNPTIVNNLEILNSKSRGKQ